MKIYKVNVNGKTYEVKLEAIEENDKKIETGAQTTQPAQNAPAKAPAASEGTNIVKAPIGGKVLKINVKSGDRVSKGDTLCIIEAMKLENEIKSPYDGTIANVLTTVGAVVANKENLFEIN